MFFLLPLSYFLAVTARIQTPMPHAQTRKTLCPARFIIGAVGGCGRPVSCALTMLDSLGVRVVRPEMDPTAWRTYVVRPPSCSKIATVSIVLRRTCNRSCNLYATLVVGCHATGTRLVQRILVSPQQAYLDINTVINQVPVPVPADLFTVSLPSWRHYTANLLISFYGNPPG